MTRCTFVGKAMSLLFNMLFRLVISFLTRSKCLLISWLQSPPAVILLPKKIKSVTVSIIPPSIYHEVMGPNIPCSHAILFFTALGFTSITSHIHNWALLLLWLHLFILSGVISLLFSSSILGTYKPGEFTFQCHIVLPFHTVHGVLKARILKWFAIPFSSGPHFVRTLHYDLSVSGGPTQHGS